MLSLWHIRPFKIILQMTCSHLPTIPVQAIVTSCPNLQTFICTLHAERTTGLHPPTWDFLDERVIPRRTHPFSYSPPCLLREVLLTCFSPLCALQTPLTHLLVARLRCFLHDPLNCLSLAMNVSLWRVPFSQGIVLVHIVCTYTVHSPYKISVFEWVVTKSNYKSYWKYATSPLQKPSSSALQRPPHSYPPQCCREKTPAISLPQLPWTSCATLVKTICPPPGHVKFSCSLAFRSSSEQASFLLSPCFLFLTQF